jgi:hypothetical protein
MRSLVKSAPGQAGAVDAVVGGFQRLTGSMHGVNRTEVSGSGVRVGHLGRLHQLVELATGDEAKPDRFLA